jgi:aminopeptidase N
MEDMPVGNLTRDEAVHRAALIATDSYAVGLDLTTSTTTFRSTTVIRFSCCEPGASTFADLMDATVSEVRLNGRSIDPSTAYDGARLALDDLAADNELRVVADCRYSRTGEGLHRFVDPADDRVYLYTQFEVPNARRVFTSFEQPDLKASFQFSVTAPDGWEVVSNSPTPEPVPVRDGVSEWRFTPTERISTYITAIVAGEYAVERDSYAGRGGLIPLGLFCRQSMRDFLDADDIFETTKQGFGFFEPAFEMAYPFGKYDQLFVPEYNMGAMENAGCVTFRDEYLFRSRTTAAAYEGRANTILHEMAHMWFGDLVTMRWWDDLWLNESFAEWAAHHAATRATKYTEAWTSFCNSRKTWAYRQDQLPSTHPIAADNYDLEAVEVNFDGITYAKGAAALRQLVAWVGEEEFFAGLRLYFTRHAFGNTELTDLLKALEETSGRELGSWAKEWLQTAGVNTLRAEFEVDDDGHFTSFAIVQSALPDHPTLRRHRVAVSLYDRSDAGLTSRFCTEIDIQGDHTVVPELIGVSSADLVLLNEGDLTYAKIRLDERSLATVVGGIDTFHDSLPRALCWGAAWDMTRDAEMATSDFLALVLRGIATETDMTAVSVVLRQANTAVELYSAPANRSALQDELERGLRLLLEQAEPGSDHQVAFARAYATAVRSEDGADYLVSLLDDSARLEGLEVDTDLRWQAVVSLASLGRYGAAEIDAELARDNTIAGRQNAAGARAAMPSAQAKESAWHDCVVRDDVPNETQRSIAMSFQRPGQEAVLAPYVDRYLEAARTVWDDKGVQRASAVLQGLFPRWQASADVVARVDNWLSETDVNPAARRLVTEGRDDMVRALRAQQRDAA